MKKALAGFAALALSVTLAVATHSSALASLTCSNTSTGNTALTDLGTRSYQGEQGGLYPGGSNTPPAAYQTAGIAAGRSVVPLDGSGRASASGSVVFLSIGMSNTSMEFTTFANNESKDGALSRAVAMVNGAQGGKVATDWVNQSSGAVWSIVEQRLAAAGFTDQQVEVIWLKEADYANQLPSFETYARTLTQELTQITATAAQRYPNLRQMFVSARSYGGYGGIYPATPLGGPNPEPWAYQTGFADKWFVAQSVASPSQRPWVGWGPYFWTDGTRGRADGLQWLCSDTVDGTHPSVSGQAKIYAYMHSQFASSAFTPWFGGSTSGGNPSPSPVPVRSPVPTPVATPAQSPGATHHATAQPGGAQHSTAPASSAPKGVGGLPGAVSSVFSGIATMQPAQRWSVGAVVILLIGALLTAFSTLVLGRRLPLVGRRGKKKPPLVSSGGINGSAPPAEVAPEAPEQPVLIGAGGPQRDSERDGQLPPQ